MIITIAGLPGAGKSTVAKILAKKLAYEYYGAGKARRDYAKELGLTIEELNEKAMIDPKSDYLADAKLEEIKDDDKIVADGWLGFHFIPKSFKVWLFAENNERAKRIFKEKRSEETYETPEKTLEKMDKRFRVTEERFNTHYGIKSISDPELFDFFIDTTNITADEAAELILAEIQKDLKTLN